MSFDAYLRRFPEPGDAFGDGTVCVDFGAARVRVHGLHETFRAALLDRFGPFQVDDDEAALDIRVVGSDSDCFVPYVPGRWEYKVEIERIEDRVRVAGIAFGAVVELGPPRAVLMFGGGPELFSQAVENVARLLVSSELSTRGGLLFHGGGIVEDGIARLFVGRSGAGKTTLCTMMNERGLTVTSDELNAVTFDDEGRAWLWGTPFAGDFGPTKPESLGPFPLEGIYLLRQSTENACREASPATAYATLFAAAPFLNSDPHQVSGLESVLDTLVSRVSVRDLHFRKDPDVWRCVA